jgi:DNA-binding MarR family transcriptional regulator
MVVQMKRSTTAAKGADDTGTSPAAAIYGLFTSMVRNAPRDLSLTSLATLSTLDRSGPRRITELAVVEGISQPSMTTLITALERAGLVERGSDASDGRVVLVTLTSTGADYLRARRRSGTAVIAQLVDKLPAGEAALLAAAAPALEHLRDLDNERRDPAVQRV